MCKVIDLQESYLTGNLLIAMPHIKDPHFAEAVIYVCGHDEKGAMGLVINRDLSGLTFTGLLEQLDIDGSAVAEDIPLYKGGSVEIGRGFVLHTSDYVIESTMLMSGGLALTTTLDILRAIADNTGPTQALLALGHVEWAAGELEKEYHDNAWISVEATPELAFDNHLSDRWRLSMASLGIDPKVLALYAGHA